MSDIAKISYQKVFYENEIFNMHFHLNYEILYITSGRLIIYFHGKQISLTEGNLCVIPYFTPHKTEYINAEAIHVTFDSKYINNYFSAFTLKQIKNGISKDIRVSHNESAQDAINMLINDIDEYGGEGAYIYIYKIINSSSTEYTSLQHKDKIITKALTYIDENSKNKISIDQIANECNISKYYFCRLFKKELGITPVDYITFDKIRAAASNLTSTNYKIAKISDKFSFYSPKYFTKIFKSYFGISPTQFKKENSFKIKKIYYIENKN